jgi:hypothetical protein
MMLCVYNFTQHLLLLLLFGQADQQVSQLQVNQVKDKAKTKNKKTKRETKRSNHETVMNQQNYSNPYQTTSILLQVSNEMVEIAPLNNLIASMPQQNMSAISSMF